MKRVMVLKTVVVTLLLLWSTANAQSIQEDPDLVWQKDEGLSVVEFSPDGKWLLTHGTKGGDVVLRDIKNGEILQTFPGAPRIDAAHFSPDGTLIATADETGAVRLWNIAENKILYTFDDSPKSSYVSRTVSLDFSDDGKRLVLGSTSSESYIEPNVFVWDVLSGKLLWKKRVGEGASVMAQYIAGTSYLYTYNTQYRNGIICNAETGDSISAVYNERSYSNDGKYYSAVVSSGQASYKDIALYKTEKDERIITIPINQAIIYDWVFTTKNGFLTFSADDNNGLSSTQVWDVENKRQIKTISQYRAFLAISPDSMYIATTGNSGYTTRLYRANWTPTSVENNHIQTYQLSVTPNPASNQVNIFFKLSIPQIVNCSVVSITGETITEIFKEQLPEGDQSLVWKSSQAAQGIYFIQLEIAGKVCTIPVFIHRTK